jgi:hypothetical protein
MRKLDMGFHLLYDFLCVFNFHTLASGLLGFIILDFNSSDTTTLFPYVVSSWLLQTSTLFSSKSIIDTGKGSTSNFMC